MPNVSESARASFGELGEWLLGPVRMALLETALDLAIPDLLAETGDPARIAARLGAHPGNLGRLLDGLVALGLASKRDGAYANTALAERFLRRARPTYLGEMVLNLKQLQHRNLATIKELVLQGPPARDRVRGLDSEDLWRNSARHLACYQKAGMARMAADLVESLPEFPQLRRMLDLGSGPGIIAMTIVERHPDLQGVLCDTPPVLEVAAEELAARGLGGRIALLPGDYNRLDLGQGFDLVWASHCLYFAGDLAGLLTKAHQAMNPGGVFISLHEGLGAERTAPAQHILARLCLALEGQDVSMAEGQITAALRQAGFQRVESEEIRLPLGPMRLDIARKAGAEPSC